jgi:hypothetical protein
MLEWVGWLMLTIGLIVGGAYLIARQKRDYPLPPSKKPDFLAGNRGNDISP